MVSGAPEIVQHMVLEQSMKAFGRFVGQDALPKVTLRGQEVTKMGAKARICESFLEPKVLKF